MNASATVPTLWVGILHPPAVPAHPLPGPAITARLLDGFEVWVGADPLAELPPGKARTLLKLLLLQRRRPLSRARLTALFWPDADAAAARNNLNVTMHRLRRALGRGDWVRHSDEGYRLLPGAEVWLDTEQFVQHAEAGRADESCGRVDAAIGRYEAAQALYRSDLLEGDENEPALAAEAQALRDRFSQVLERLASLRERAGDWHGCLRIALRHLGLDDCNEAAHRRLMLCYSKLGQVQLAERQYRSCVSALRQQFGLSPSDETTALYRRIAARMAA